MNNPETVDPWLQPFLARVSTHQFTGPFLLCLPEYRPDLARTVATTLGCRFFDYREEVMLTQGWNAHGLSLDDLSDTLRDWAVAGPVTAFNVEALLATKSAEARLGWLKDFVATDFPNLVIVPLCIYSVAAPSAQDRVYTVNDTLPEQSFLNRLAL